MTKAEHAAFENRGPAENRPLILDFQGIERPWQVHRLLKETFGLPDYYGENWDALWDCLQERFCGAGEWVVELRGFLTLSEELRDFCRPMLEVFHDVHEEAPNVTFVPVS